MSKPIPASVRAVMAQSDLSRPQVLSLPFGDSDAVKNLGPHQVVVLNHAIGLNPTDYKHGHGEWTSRKPVVLGTESAGIALAVGSDVKHFKAGDRVAGMVYGASSEHQGAASEGLVFDAANLWAIPPDMSDLEAAAFTAGHLTSVQTLYMRWNLARPSAPDTSSPKRIILIWGGSTAVGHHAIQLCALSGYRVFTTASPANHARLKELGAEMCFDYKQSDVVSAIRQAAGPGGIFAAYDTASSNGSTNMCIDAIGDQGGKVMATLPPPPETISRRSDVQVEFVLVYTLMGYAFKFANAFDFPAMPQDRADSLAWLSNDLPPLLAEWKEGQGSARYKPQALRVMPGGLDRVYEGINVLGEGSYKAEKLVYSL